MLICLIFLCSLVIIHVERYSFTICFFLCIAQLVKHYLLSKGPWFWILQEAEIFFNPKWWPIAYSLLLLPISFICTVLSMLYVYPKYTVIKRLPNLQFSHFKKKVAFLHTPTYTLWIHVCLQDLILDIRKKRCLARDRDVTISVC